MTTVVLLILAVMWAAVLIPPMIRDRRVFGRSRDSVGMFRSQLDVLGHSRPGSTIPTGLSLPRATRPAGVLLEANRPVPMPRNAHEAERRRRDIVGVLGAAAALTLVAGAVLGSPAVWAFHVVIDVALACFFVLVVNHRRVTAERDQNVHYLHPRRVDDDPALVRQAR